MGGIQVEGRTDISRSFLYAIPVNMRVIYVQGALPPSLILMLVGSIK